MKVLAAVPDLSETCDGFCDLRWLCFEEVNQAKEIWQDEIDAIEDGIMSRADAWSISYAKRQRLSDFFFEEKRRQGFGQYAVRQNYWATYQLLPKSCENQTGGHDE